MRPTEAGTHRLGDGQDIHICDCDACLRKNGGEPKQVPRTTYFRHRSSRLARLFPPPPTPPHPTAQPTVLVQPSASSSKRPLDAFDAEDHEHGSAPRKKGRDGPLSTTSTRWEWMMVTSLVRALMAEKVSHIFLCCDHNIRSLDADIYDAGNDIDTASAAIHSGGEYGKPRVILTSSMQSW